MTDRGRQALQWIARRSLRERIGLGLAFLVFIVAILLGGVLGRSSEIQARNRIGQSLAVDAQRLAERLSAELATRDRELNLLSRMEPVRAAVSTIAIAPSLANGAPMSIALGQSQALLDELRSAYPAYAWIGVALPSGKVIVSTDPASLGTTISARNANREGGLRTGTAAPPGADDARMIDLLQPIRDADGSVIGSIAAQLPWSWVRGMARGVLSIDDDGVIRRQVFIIDSRDTVVLGPRKLVGTQLQVRSAARARAGLAGWQIEPWPKDSSDGVEQPFLTGVAFATGDAPGGNVGVQGLRWSVLVREAEQQAFAAALLGI